MSGRGRAPQKLGKKAIAGNPKLKRLLAKNDDRVSVKDLILTLEPTMSQRSIEKIVDEKFDNGLVGLLQKKKFDDNVSVWAVDPDDFDLWWSEYRRPKPKRKNQAAR